MNIRTVPIFAAGLLSFMLLCAAWPARAADVVQTVRLSPGWNAIHLAIEPNDPEIESVFAGLPIASVWRFRPTGNGPQFVRDPAENLENLDGWFAWFPQPRPEAFLTNLFRVEGNTAYLVKLSGTVAKDLVIRGKPRLRALKWSADAFTLTGLPVAANGAPSFASFFDSSAAHRGQPVYSLAADGRWNLVSAQTAIQEGRAYWIRSEGPARFQGPMQVVLDGSDTLEYSAALTEIRFVVRNQTPRSGSFLIERIGGGQLPLSFQTEDPESGEIGWPNLGSALSVPVAANSEAFVTLSVRRRDFIADRMEEILSVRDEMGGRVLLSVGGNSIQPDAPVARAAATGAKGLGQSSYAGLWVGDASVERVSESQNGGTQPTPVNHPFTQRLIIHVDSNGQARLLKDVIQMWQDGQSQPSAENPSLQEVAVPGRYVLLTDKSLLGFYSGATQRGGAPVGLRYSTVAYDFAGDAIELAGDFVPGTQLAGTIVIGADLPTNPFKHRYHPDHDNLDAQFLNPRAESYEVVRSMQLSLLQDDPSGSNPPRWGDSIVGGTFRETVTGLHRNAIFVAGEFRLQRVSAVPVLNQ